MFKTTLMVVCILASLLVLPQRQGIEPPIILTPDQQIVKLFGTKSEVMKAVFIAESNFEVAQISYNCRYKTPEGKIISKACKKDDRHQAWSVDCGIAQINVKGKVCPPHLLVVETNLEEAYKIYKTQGMKAWVAYNSGAYKKYLKSGQLKTTQDT